ncbi:type II secretion system minor pseudopilin GspK [Legionella waltersii]|uniref:Type II secretion system protein K n=1 Tax=Legionella waltersii TaxID=66969 RepID=A0A0W1ALW4_9GAMM|nr:type II secretion system minor pseudopilin GspK [Legionella waltersii]KTD82341.1 type II secretory pathway protein [Legionella waltersii]SNV03945.1 general secretion pathway protein K [Legionella waltersii]
MCTNNKHHGSALLTALFIMTLVAIVATAMTTRLQLDIYRTRMIVNQDKLYFASQAVTFWAINDLYDKNNHYFRSYKEGLVAEFPRELAKLDNSVQLGGGIYDLQARFNINNLIEKKNLSVFMNLMHQLNTQATSLERVNIALGVKHWLLDYRPGQGEDNYTSYYLSLKPPYYPAHQTLKSSSELRLLKDVDQSMYLNLEPFITALPESTSVNINTAPTPVIMALGDGLSESQANELIQARGSQGISDIKSISELLKKMNLPSDQITIESQYFLCLAYAKTEDFDLVVYSLLKRTRDKKGKLSVKVIRESLNSF